MNSEEPKNPSPNLHNDTHTEPTHHPKPAHTRRTKPETHQKTRLTTPTSHPTHLDTSPTQNPAQNPTHIPTQNPPQEYPKHITPSPHWRPASRKHAQQLTFSTPTSQVSDIPHIKRNHTTPRDQSPHHTPVAVPKVHHQNSSHHHHNHPEHPPYTPLRSSGTPVASP
jgi:hypothetical protein